MPITIIQYAYALLAITKLTLVIMRGLTGAYSVGALGLKHPWENYVGAEHPYAIWQPVSAETRWGAQVPLTLSRDWRNKGRERLREKEEGREEKKNRERRQVEAALTDGFESRRLCLQVLTDWD